MENVEFHFSILFFFPMPVSVAEQLWNQLGRNEMWCCVQTENALYLENSQKYWCVDVVIIFSMITNVDQRNE